MSVSRVSGHEILVAEHSQGHFLFGRRGADLTKRVAPEPELSPFVSKYNPLDALYCATLLFRDLVQTTRARLWRLIF